MATQVRNGVKIVTHGDPSTSRLAAIAGLIVGAIAGAGAAIKVKPGKTLNSSGASSQDSQTETKSVGPFDKDAAGIENEKQARGPKGRLLAFAERRNWRWLGRTLQVIRRYSELEGNNLAAAVTLQTFLSLFPLLLVAVSVVGFIVENNSQLPQQIINAMGLEGAAAESMRSALETARDSRKASSIIGFVTLIWSALGVTSALQFAYNQGWQVSGRGLKDKAIGLAWLAGASLLFVATAAITTAIGWLPAEFGIAATLVALLLNLVLWMFTAKILPNVNISWRDVVPGAIVGVIGLEVLKFLGGIWVPKAVASSSSLYGTIGVVLAILAWLLFFGKLVVYSAVVNVVRSEARHGVTTSTIELPKPAAQKQEGVTRSGQAATA